MYPITTETFLAWLHLVLGLDLSGGRGLGPLDSQMDHGPFGPLGAQMDHGPFEAFGPYATYGPYGPCGPYGP